mmetsp:Transcript_4641/g.5246  ORF Transcript_4641/g.5246 Transcript_4641/m.5246 type:complete len:745 (-) Transcript_4641:1395-3629(-)
MSESLGRSTVSQGFDPLAQLNDSSSGSKTSSSSNKGVLKEVEEMDKRLEKPDLSQVEESKKKAKATKKKGNSEKQKNSEPGSAAVVREKISKNDYELKGQDLLRGEVNRNAEKASYVLGSYAYNGVFYITNFKIVFKPDDVNFLRISGLPSDYFTLPLGLIYRVACKKDAPKAWVMELQSKDCRFLKFNFALTDRCQGFISYLNNAAILATTTPFAFLHYESIEHKPENTGWEVYDVRGEYERIGFDLDRNSDWRLSSANDTRRLCKSYPKYLIVSNKISDNQADKVAQFRTKGRLPAVVWKHKNNDTTISRSSQCMAGLKQNRCAEDESYLGYLAQQNKGDKNLLHIYDARPYINAVANRVKNGAGFESKDFYQNCDIFFLNIPNIHVIRDSFKKMQSICSYAASDSSKFYSQLDSSSWMDYISLILQGTARIAKDSLSNGYSVLIHCSDGWDRTSQLSALAQLCSDPYYRTYKGFQVLVEKEWVSFGFQFALRCSQCNNRQNGDDHNNFSPIFLQFLDCVYQLLCQYPTSFEFNSAFLADLAYHIHSDRYGTFLYNHQADREEFGVREKTLSYWTATDGKKSDYLNPFYDENLEITRRLLEPNHSLKKMKLWEDYFLRYNPCNYYPYPGIYSAHDHMCQMMNDQKTISSSIQIYKDELSRYYKMIASLKKRMDEKGIPYDDIENPAKKSDHATEEHDPRASQGSTERIQTTSQSATPDADTCNEETGERETANAVLNGDTDE